MRRDAVQGVAPGEGRKEEMVVARLSTSRWLRREEKRSAKAAGVQHPRYATRLLFHSFRCLCYVATATKKNDGSLFGKLLCAYVHRTLGRGESGALCPCPLDEYRKAELSTGKEFSVLFRCAMIFTHRLSALIETNPPKGHGSVV